MTDWTGYPKSRTAADIFTMRQADFEEEALTLVATGFYESTGESQDVVDAFMDRLRSTFEAAEGVLRVP